jgi:membrane-bound lytic murein transglycosylase B
VQERSIGKAALTGALAVAAVALVLAAAPSAQTGNTPRPSFGEWLAGVRAEALTRGIRAEIVDQALADVSEPLPIIG